MEEFHISFGGRSKTQKRGHYTYMLCVDGDGAYNNVYRNEVAGGMNVYLVVGKLKKYYKSCGNKLAKIVMDAKPFLRN